MSFARRLILLFAMLCLIGAQQAAFAHWAGHLGATAQSALESSDTRDEAASLSQFCAVCAAFTALDSALPTTAMPTPSSTAINVVPLLDAVSAPLIHSRHYDSRAPPAVL